MNQNEPFYKRKNFYLLMGTFAFLLFCFGIVGLLAIAAILTGQNSFISLLLVTLVVVGGMTGGLGYEIREDRLALPGWKTGANAGFSPGCLGSMLYGILGGVVIFTITPGNFDLNQGALEIIKVFGLAAVGGYGGRVLIENALNKWHKDLEKMQITMEQVDLDAEARMLVQKQLDGDPDTPVVPEEKMTAAILNATPPAQEEIFYTARTYRKQAKVPISEITRVVPVFKGLLKTPLKELHHRCYAQIAYALIESNECADNVNWIEVNTYVDYAIIARNGTSMDAVFEIYEFHKAVCLMRLKPDALEEIRSLLESALHGRKTSNWVRQPNEEYITGAVLADWLRANDARLGTWLQREEIKLAPEEEGKG